MPSAEVRSPRIAALQHELAAGGADALTRFWREVEDRGTPLIEDIPDDEAHKLVTFLWRGDGDTRAVALIGCSLVHPDWSSQGHVLARLAGSDVWYRTYRVRADARATYRLSPNNPGVLGLQATQEEREATWLVDPMNRHPWQWRRNPADYTDGRERPPTVTVSTVALPAAPAQPWSVSQPDVPAGQVTEHRMSSAVLQNERRVWVYVPPGFAAERGPYALAVFFDGFDYLHTAAAATVLDDLRHAGKLPPVIAAFVDTPLPTRGDELPCNPRFAAFVTGELLPWLQSEYAVAQEASRRLVAGVSFGGLASAYIAFNHPGAFGSVLAQGGSFYWPAREDDYEQIARQVVAESRLPLRFHLDVGRFDTFPRPAGVPVILASNRHLRDVLLAKGYALHYEEFSGGHEWFCWRGTLANGLVALLG